MARHLDTTLLAPMANASAFTGFVLAAGTAWGYFRHWWVLIKFAITLIQLYLGIFVLSARLDTAISSARTGNTTGWALPVGAALMAGAIGVQAWFSIAKPLGRTPWSLRAGRSKPATASAWLFAIAVAAAVVDLGLATWLGYPLPACSVLALVVVLTRRARRRAVQPRRARSVDVASGATGAG